MTEMHTAARRQDWRGVARLAAAGQIALWMVVWARPAPVMAAQAYVVGTDDDERWVIGNDQIRLTVEAGSAGEVRLLDLTVPQADTSWTVPTARPSGAGGAVAGAAFTGATAYTDLTIARLELGVRDPGQRPAHYANLLVCGWFGRRRHLDAGGAPDLVGVVDRQS